MLMCLSLKEKKNHLFKKRERKEANVPKFKRKTKLSFEEK